MQSHSPLVATVIISLVLASIGGVAARQVKLPPLFGYVLAGMVIGPFTPGFIADQSIIEDLAEIGVALLLFGVGLHFSLRDLAAVWRIAVPGALVQVAASASLGFAAGRFIGFAPGAALVLAGCLAVASTVVATRALEQRQKLPTPAGRFALGWLVMQDLVVVAVLVLLPGRAGVTLAAAGAAARVGVKLVEVIAFVGAMLIVGRRVIPWVLARTARDGSHELFRLVVIAVALGIAYLSSQLIGVSMALGAFFAGVVIADSDVSHQAAGESVPVQQVFTVLFFVSVGMLLDPAVVLRMPLQVAAVAATILVGNVLVTLLVLLGLRVAPRDAAEVAATLAQIGEFSFILSGTAVASGLLPAAGRDLVLTAALVSILMQPLMFRIMARVGRALEGLKFLRRWHAARGEPRREGIDALAGHAILVGHGRVGVVVAAALRSKAIPYVVIEQNWRFAELLRRDGIPVVYGDAAWSEVLEAAGIERARLLAIAIPDKRATRRILAQARHANPGIDIVIRTHDGDEAAWLSDQSVGRVVMGELHTAREMADYAIERFGQH
ncbi:MAG TPA: cation:proton antiporter [Stellaceae bacterium]|nr:cation:proton antiporter [Stellaceae bacterium]